MHCLLYGNSIRVASRLNKQSIFEPHSAPSRLCTYAPKSATLYKSFKFTRKRKLAACARLNPLIRTSFGAPETRDNALYTVCCMETLYVSLRDATNKMFLNPSLRPYAFVHPPQTSSLCTHCFIMVGGHSGI